MSSAAETIALWRRSAFVWGETDCCLSVMDHVEAMTGSNPSSPWRGLYGDEDGAALMAAPYGGIGALVAHAMARAGFQQGAATDGAVIVARIMGREIAGIMVGDMTAFRMERGVMEARVPIMAAWPL